MPDEVAAAAAYGSKMNPQIVESRLNAQGGIISVNYGAAADELTGYETALKESLATVTPAPSVTQVRYLQEYQRETARAAKKYGGGVLAREAAAIARLWCGTEFGAPYGRGLPYTTLQKVAFDLFGLTLPSAQTYQTQTIYAEHNYDPETSNYFLGGSTGIALEQVSDTYEKETIKKAWLRAVVDASHQGASVEFWLRWRPTGINIDDPYAVSSGARVLPIAYHHPTGLSADETCWLSLFQTEAEIFFNMDDLVEGVQRVEHFTGIEIGTDNAIEIVIHPDDDMERIGDLTNEFTIDDDWEILWSAP
jgi:hypothetical protein